MAGVRGAALLALASVVATLGIASTADAGGSDPPWSSGPDVDSPLEAAAGAAVSDVVVGRTVRVRCNGEEEWEVVVAALGWDPGRIAGFAWPGASVAELSPATCLDLDQFWNDGAAEKRCLGTFVSFRTTTVRVPVRVRKKVRVRVDGKWRTRVKVVTAWRETRQDVPVLEDRLVRCGEFPQRTQAVQTLAHEAFHLAGVRDEAAADCSAIQKLDAVARRLGADWAFATDMQAWAWSWYQEHQGAKPPQYFSPECRADGALDLTPGDGRWP